jgi:hypothetical protein
VPPEEVLLDEVAGCPQFSLEEVHAMAATTQEQGAGQPYDASSNDGDITHGLPLLPDRLFSDPKNIIFDWIIVDLKPLILNSEG